MNLTINVDESMFKEIIDKELKAFTPEELHDIVKEMIKEYLKDNDVIKALFVQKKFSSYSSNDIEATDFLKKIVNTIDLSEGCEEIKDSMVDVIKNDAKGIVTDLFAKSISRSLFKSWEAEGWLKESIVSTFVEMQNHNR